MPFDATCEKCNKYLHVCLNCAMHDPLAKQGCRHEAGEPGPSPTAKNFCDAFVFRESLVITTDEEKLDRKSAEKKWNELFGSV